MSKSNKLTLTQEEYDKAKLCLELRPFLLKARDAGLLELISENKAWINACGNELFRLTADYRLSPLPTPPKHVPLADLKDWANCPWWFRHETESEWHAIAKISSNGIVSRNSAYLYLYNTLMEQGYQRIHDRDLGDDSKAMPCWKEVQNA